MGTYTLQENIVETAQRTLPYYKKFETNKKVLQYEQKKKHTKKKQNTNGKGTEGSTRKTLSLSDRVRLPILPVVLLGLLLPTAPLLSTAPLLLTDLLLPTDLLPMVLAQPVAGGKGSSLS